MKNNYTFVRMLIVFLISFGSLCGFAQDPLIVGSISANQAICSGISPAPLVGIGPANGTNPTFQWQSSLDNFMFTDIVGATVITYQPGVLSTTTYYRQMQNAEGTTGGPLPTNVVTITIKPALVGGSIYPNQSVCSGVLPGLLHAIPPSTGTSPTYQWQLSLTGSIFFNLSGATNQNYQPNPQYTSVDSLTYYFRQIQNDPGTCYGPHYTNVITLTILPALLVGAISENQSVCTGMVPNPLTGTPPTNGTNHTFQWQSSVDNIAFANISGATLLNYQPEALTTTTWFRLQQNASSTCGGPLPTNVVTITVMPNLIVGSISADQSFCTGTLPVQLNGVAPTNGTSPTYQWQSSLDNITFNNIAGATSLNYLPGSVIVTTYFRQMQNASGICDGPKPTNVVTITVNPLPTATISGSASICKGFGAPISIAFTGAAPWNFTLYDGVMFYPVTGIIENPYNTIVLPLDSSLTYTIPVVSDANLCSNVGAGAAVITVIPRPTATISGDNTICDGSESTLIVDLTGSQPWTIDITNGTTTITVGGITHSPYTLNVSPEITTTYTVTSVIDATICPGFIFGSAVVTVNPLPAAVAGANRAICLGESTQIGSEPVAGNTYSWISNPAGFTSTQANPIVAPLATTKFIVVETITATGCFKSDSVVVSVNPLLAVGSISDNQTICAGTIPVQLNGVAPASGSEPTYQWQSSPDNITFGNIAGATLLNYQPGFLTVTTYFRQLQNASGTCDGPKATNVVAITVDPLPTATISGTTTICKGFGAPLSIAFTGTAPWNFTVYDGVMFYPVTGNLENPYNFSVLPLDGSLTYTVTVVSDATLCSNVGSGSAVVTVNEKPTAIISGDATICNGSSAVLSVALTGAQPWEITYSDGTTPVTVSGITVSPYTFSVSPTSTVTYTVTSVVDTKCPNLGEGSATVVVDQALEAGSISADQTICMGTLPDPLIGVAPWNGTSPTYQWQSSLDNITFSNIAGATSLNYQPAGVTGVTYFRQMQNATGVCGGPLPTNVVTITVNALPTATISGTATICKGFGSPLSIAFTGSAPWNFTLYDGVMFYPVTGINENPYNFSVLPLDSSLTYTVTVVSDATLCSNVGTGSAVVTVNPKPTAIISGDATICAGSSAVLSVALTGALPWDITYTDGTTPVTVTGITASPYTFSVSPTSTATYTVTSVVDTKCPNLGEGSATVVVDPNLAVGSISADQTICAGTLPGQLIGVAPSNGTSPTYQWQSSLDNITFTNITGATTLNYQPGGLTGINYFRQMQNASGTCGGPLPTNIVTISVSVDPELIVGSISADQTICAGTLPGQLIGVAPSNGTSPSYQWQSSLDNITFGNIAGATSLNYSPGVATGVTYFRQMQDATGTCGGPLPTNVVTITVNALPTATISGSAVICKGFGAPLTVALTGVAPWDFTYSDGVNLITLYGVTDPSYNLNVWPLSSMTYTVTDVSDATMCSNVGAGSAVVTVNERPTATISGDATICAGLSTVLSVALTGTLPWGITYTDGTTPVTVTGITASPYTFSVSPTAATTYTVTSVTDANCPNLGEGSATVVVDPTLAVGSISADQTICEGTLPGQLIGVAPSNGTSPTYQWQSSLDNITFSNIAGSTALNYQPGALTGVTYFRQMQNATGVCGGPLPTNVVTITVNALPTATISGSAVICKGFGAPLTVALTGVAPWDFTYSDGVNLITLYGVTDPLYNLNVWPLSSMTYTVTDVSDATLCSNIGSGSAVVTVNEKPTAIISGDATICAGSSAVLSVALTGALPWDITYSDGTTPVTVTGITASPYTFSVSPTSTTTYTVTSVTDTKCPNLGEGSATVVVDPNLAVGSISPNQTICAGTLPAQLIGVAPSNGTSPTYQWQSSMDNVTFSNIAGATSLNYQPDAATAITYFRQMQNASGTCGGPLPTNVVTITVNALPTATISGSAVICKDFGALLTVAFTGTPPWDFTYSNGVDLIPKYGITDPIYNITVYPESTMTYTIVVVSDATTCSNVGSGSAVVTVKPKPTAIMSGDATICSGSSAVLSVALTGVQPWDINYWDGTTLVTVIGITASPYTFSVSPASTKTYTVTVVTDATSCSNFGEGFATVVVDPALAVGSISADQTICAGTLPAQLIGVAPSNGTSPTYQWQSSLDNITFTNVAGATLLNYQPGALTVTTKYRQMQNATGVCGGPLPTNVVTITVNADPLLIVGSIGVNQSICSGSVPAQLTGIPPSTGTAPTYQWQSSLDNVTFININGATSLNYQPGAVTAVTYFRQMQDASGACGGPLPTNVVTISLNPDLIVGSIAADQTICMLTKPGQLNGVAPANGTAPTYQWQSSLDNLNFANINGATMLNYQPNLLSFTTYFRQLQNATGTCLGPLPTNTVTITINPDLIVGSIGSNQTIGSGSIPAMLTGIAPLNGTSPSYQWQISTDNITFTDISGAISLNYQPDALTSTTYFRLLQNALGTCAGPLPTNVVTITVNPALLVGSISANQSICAGQVPSQLVGIGPYNGTAPTYQWQSSLDNSTFTNITGATSLNYQPGAVNVITYFRQMQNASGASGGPLPTNVVTISMNPDLIVGSIGTSQIICEGAIPAQLTAVAPSNGTSPTYQWQSSLDNSTFTNIAGATTLNYQPGAVIVTTYFRQTQDASGACGGPLPTNVITISITPLLVVGSASADQNICNGETPSPLNALPPSNGTSPTYQWQSSLDNVTYTNIGGATALIYQPGALTVTTKYRQMQDASGTCGGPLPTNVVTITVNADPLLIVGSIGVNQSICSGSIPAQLTGIPPSNGTAPTYQWQSSLDNSTFTNIAGATTLNYQPGAMTAVTYFRQTQDASGTCGGPLPTNVVTISITPQLVVGSVSANQSICSGGIPALLNSIPPANGTSPTYQWQSSLDNVTFTNIFGATVQTYQPGSITGVTYFRQMQDASGTCGGPLPTNVVTITVGVDPALIVGSIAANQSICSGSIPAQLTGIPPSTGTSPTYQWQSSLDNSTFTNIIGATSLNYQPGAVTAITYFRQIQNASGACGGPLPTNVVTISMNPALVVGSISANQTICAGAIPAQLTGVGPSNGTFPTYQWQSSLDNSTFTNISGATLLNYQPGALTSITYFRQTQNAFGACGGPLPTNVVTITVNPLLVVGSISANQAVCTGSIPAQLNGIAPTNGTSPTYQWQNSTDNITFTDIPGETSLNYQPGALIVTMYFRQMQNASGVCGGPLPTNVVVITVNPDLVVGSISANQSVCAGTIPAQLIGVGPSNGTSPTYQWQSSLDNITFGNIAGATSLNYQPGAVTAITYFRQMQDASGTCGGPLPTNVVTISMSPDLVVGSISANQTICTGTIPAQLTGVGPSNGTSPTYQWQSSLDNSTFTNISGATLLNYQPGALTGIAYFRQMQDASGVCSGPLPTNVVTITVNPLLVVGSISANQTVCTGSIPAQLNGVAPANGTLPTYQWQNSTDNITFTDIPGETGLNYQPGALIVTMYFRQMQDASGTCGGPLPTNVVTITVNPDLVVGSIAADQSVCSNTLPALLTATPPANGTAPTYQWQSSLDNITFSNIIGATSQNYQSGLLSVTTYFRQMQNASGTCGGPLPTNVVTITVSEALVVGSISADQTICSGFAPALLIGVPPSNGTLPTYQWQSSLTNFTFTDINGATDLNYQPGILTNTIYYRLMQNATGVCGGPLPTNVVAVTVTPTLAVGSISADQTICNGSIPALLTGVPPSNGSSPVYQWQSSLDNVTFTNIIGATSLNYQPGSLTAITYFRLMQDASGACGGPLPTNTVTITVGAFPALIVGSISGNQSLCIGNVPALLTGTPPSNGTLPTYQWQSALDNFSFTDINGATALNYQPGALAATIYYRQMQNAQGTCGGPLSTNVVTITVNPPLAVGSISADQAICSGSIPALLNGVAPSNGTAPTYQWQSSLNGSSFANISGATMLNYQPGALTVTTYYRQMQDASGTCGGPLATNIVTITMNPTIVVGSISANQAICSGAIPALLNGVAPSNGTAPTYQWQSSLNGSTFANISGATMLNYQPGALTVTTYYRQMQDASGTCGGPLPTNMVTISMNPTIVVGSISASQAICSGAIPALLNGVAPSNGTSPTYQWQSSLDGSSFNNISGATMLNYQPGALTVTTYYRQQQNASGACGGPAPTNIVTITMNPTIAVGSISADQAICIGAIPALLNGVAPSNGTAPTYQWQSSLSSSGFANISGATMLNYQPGALTVTTYYRQMQNASGTCGGPLPTNFVIITVNPLPVPTITGPASVCLNSTGNVYTTQAGMTGYTWTVTGGLITAGNGTNAITVTWNTVGAKTVCVNYTNANGCTATTPVCYNVTVNPLPVPTITGPASVCLNSTGNVYTTQTGMTGYTWTVTGGAITAGSLTNSITVTWNTVGVGTVCVNYTNANGCTAATPVCYNVTVNPLPVPTITGPASVCLNSTGNVYTTQTGMTGYTWTVTGGAITAGAVTNSITVTWNTVGVGTVCVNYTNANGCTATTPVCYNVTVNPLPVPTITGPAIVCLNSTGNVYTTQAGMTGYTWTVTGGAITAGVGTNAVTITWNSIGVKTVCVNYTNANGCTALAPVCYNVTVNPLPVPTITGAASACVNSTGNVYTTEAGMTGYSWTVSGGAATGVTTNTITVTWNTVGVQTITVNYTNANGCSASTPTSKTVTVNPLPVPTITGPSSVCVGTTSNVYTTEAGMTGYTWTVAAGGNITSGGATNAITVTWTSAGAKTVCVNYTNTNGCTAAAPTCYNVTVNAIPTPTITGPATVCQGATATYTTQTGMTNYLWTVAGGTIISGGSTTSNTITITWNIVGNQAVTVNYTSGCPGSAPVTYNVTVNPTPVPTIGSTNNPCIGSTNNVYYTESGMTGYIWTVSNGTISSGQGTSVLTVTWTQPGIQTVTVNYTNASGCSAPQPTVYTVFVNSPPNAANPITGTATVCAGTNGVVYSTTPIVGATSYNWVVTGGGTFTGQGTTSITVNFPANATSGAVKVEGMNQCGPGPSSTFAVTVNPLPAAAGTITGPTSVCAGSSGVTYTVPAIANATSYLWTVTGATFTGTANSIVVNFSVNPGTVVITVKGVNSCGSGVVSPSFTVTVNPIPAAPVVTAAGAVLTSSATTGNQWYYEGTGLLPGAVNQTYTATITGWYWSVVTVNGCSSDTSNHVYVLFVGQDELPGSSFNVYPVPNNGNFRVAITTPSEEIFTIRVYNQLGVMVYEMNDARTIGGKFNSQVNLNDVADGLYSVVFLNEQHKVIRKMIVSKLVRE